MADFDVTAFSDQQQAAVLGHVLKKPDLWHRLELVGVTKDWFLSDDLAAAWDLMKSHRAELGKTPNGAELVEHWVAKHDETNRESATRTVKYLLEHAGKLPLDTLDAKLLEWAGSRIVAEHMTQAAKEFNAGKHGDARRTSHAAAAALRKLDQLTGESDRFIPANVRARKIEAMIEMRAKRKLRFGVPFFDDALRGIFMNDVILAGARSGAGKTELARIVAETNARAKARVAVFALEAFEGEYEARMKFAFMAQCWRDDNPGDAEFALLDYGDWIDGDDRVKAMLAPYKNRADAEFDENLSTLQTYYRARGHFGTSDFEREATLIGEESDLVVLDHVHYVDLDGKDENREMTQLMKTISDVSYRIGVPFFIIAHLRKSQAGGKVQALVPDMDEFHGASGLTKIATGAIMLARAPGSESRGADTRTIGDATLQRIVKSRTHGGAAMRHTALGFFDRRQSRYSDAYGLGELSFNGMSWRSLKEEKKIPRWVKHEVIMDLGDIK